MLSIDSQNFSYLNEPRPQLQQSTGPGRRSPALSLVSETSILALWGAPPAHTAHTTDPCRDEFRHSPSSSDFPTSSPSLPRPILPATTSSLCLTSSHDRNKPPKPPKRHPTTTTTPDNHHHHYYYTTLPPSRNARYRTYAKRSARSNTALAHRLPLSL
ncbi:hypothetical protein CSOJ01_10875 [Colletotrichum sojae]|uniref:Uncharacterized protein n=1 Tax=Colletotrichum sojae TaxID=2175907 RepID=A0A8H6IZE0_9PEZI|nr:hypothetical protein CSOJ01_10875 [Colletotrichum sojae]